MNIKLVYSFLTLCKYKKITVASKKLNISHQGLSSQIQTLENDLDIKLFKRCVNGVELTEQGVQLYSYFKDFAHSYELLVGAVDKFRVTDKESIRVGVAQGVTSAIGLDFLVEFRKTYPNIEVELIELYDKQCYDHLIENKVDFAFLVQNFDQSNLDNYLVYEDYPYVAINKSHPLAFKKHSIHMKDLHNQPVLILDEQYNLRNTFDEICINNNIEPVILFSANTVASYLNIANEIISIAVIMKFIIPYVDKKNVVFLPLSGGPVYKVCFSKKSQQDRSKHLVKFEEFVSQFFKIDAK